MKLAILQGNVFDKIKEIPDNSIDLCITSPPYWGLRDYGIEGQLGNEPTMEKYLDNTLLWVKEVYRVLKPTGSLVINIGDCFIGGGRGSAETRAVGGTRALGKGQAPPPDWKELKAKGTRDWKYNSTPCAVSPLELTGIYKTKQLLSVSSFLYCKIVSETEFVCRGEHIWAKPNVPSPIRSRLKHSHEKLFWFVKDADKYYFDSKAWMKKVTSKIGGMDTIGRAFLQGTPNFHVSKTSTFQNGKRPTNEETIEHSWRIVPVGAKQSGFELSGKEVSEHIAPFPENLIRPYIKSLTPKDGIVLDPFLGSGTTMRVAMENGRDSIGIELNEKYIRYAKKRLNWKAGLDVEYGE